MTKPVMLILRGIAGEFDGKDYPRGALDEPSALEYARRRGYEGVVLDVAGKAYAGSPQVQAALTFIEERGDVEALYGFSGGGYNVRHIIHELSETEEKKLKLVVVIGVPHNEPELYKGHWELIYWYDPPEGHMAGPRVLLRELIEQELRLPPEPPPTPEPKGFWVRFFDGIFQGWGTRQ